MRPLATRPRLLLATMAVLAAPGLVRAQSDCCDSALVTTSASILYEPSSFVVRSSGSLLATSYVVPRSYVVPTVYDLTPTSYVVPTSYYTTTGLFNRRIVRRPVFGSSYVATSYVDVPTRIYSPTTITLDMPRVSSDCCAPVVATTLSSDPCDVPIASSSRAVSAPVTSSAPAQDRPAPRAAATQPAPPEPQLAPEAAPMRSTTRPTTPAPAPIAAPGPVDSPPPAAPAEPPPSVNTDQPLVPLPPDAPLSGSPPNGGASTAPALDGPAQRVVMRPSYGSARVRLDGKVASAVSGKPESAVAVTLVPNSNLFRNRVATTDDQGRFAILLTDGDWTVQVPRPDGKGTIDRLITVSGGLVTDEKDREVTSLTVSR